MVQDVQHIVARRVEVGLDLRNHVTYSVSYTLPVNEQSGKEVSQKKNICRTLSWAARKEKAGLTKKCGKEGREERNKSNKTENICCRIILYLTG
jgi:hypothetical protein